MNIFTQDRINKINVSFFPKESLSSHYHFMCGLLKHGPYVFPYVRCTLYSTQSTMKIKTYLPNNPVKDALLILLVDNLIALDRRLV